MEDYKKIIKELQLNGTLNDIREEIRLHYNKEFSREDKEREIVHMHFINVLMDRQGFNPKHKEQINLAHYNLSMEDKEFMTSRREYQDRVDAIIEKENEEYFKEIECLAKRASKETRDSLIDLFDNSGLLDDL